MAIIKKELPLVFQYIQISSPIPFYIYGSDNEKAKRLLPSNAYVLRSAELLTSEKAPNQPIWKVYIEYDDSLLTDGRIVEINGFNVDFSKYLETFGGQLVRFGDDQFQGLYTVINSPAWVSSVLETVATSANQKATIPVDYVNYGGFPNISESVKVYRVDGNFMDRVKNLKNVGSYPLYIKGDIDIFSTTPKDATKYVGKYVIYTNNDTGGSSSVYHMRDLITGEETTLNVEDTLCFLRGTFFSANPFFCL